MPLPDVRHGTTPAPRPTTASSTTGFAALDAILGPGGLPRSASVAIRGDGSSGRTTLVLRLAAEAQAAGLDRRLARSLAQLRPGRGGRPWHPARVARGHHPGHPRRRPGHRWRAAGRSLGRSPRPRPARRPARSHGPPGPHRRPARPAGGARPAVGDALRRARATGPQRRPGRPPSPSRPGSAWNSPGARGSGSDATSSASRRRRWSPATATARRVGGRRSGSSTRRAASATPVSVGTTSWPDPPNRSAPDPRPRDPPGTDPPRCDSSISTGRTSPSNSPGREPPSLLPFPPGPLILGGRPWDPGPVVDASPEARALGVRRGMPLGSAHRLVPEAFFIDPDPDADRATIEAAFEALAAFSPGIAGSADPTDAAFGLFEVQVDGLEAAVGAGAGPHRAAGRGARARPR